MDLELSVETILQQSIEARIHASETLPASVADAADLIAQTLLDQGTLFLRGDKNAFATTYQLQHWLMNGHDRARPGLPAVMLSAHEHRSIKPAINELKTLAKPQDALLLIGSSKARTKLHELIVAAHECDLGVIALTHEDNNEIAALLTDKDIWIPLPATVNSDAASADLMLTTCWALCDLIDTLILGPNQE